MERNIDGGGEGHTSWNDDTMEAGFKSNAVEKEKEDDTVPDNDVSVFFI